MPTSLVHPVTGRRATVDLSSLGLALIFGPLYFLARGLWMSLAIQLLLWGAFFYVLGPLGIFGVAATWLVSAIMAPTLARRRLILKGYQVTPD